MYKKTALANVAAALATAAFVLFWSCVGGTSDADNGKAAGGDGGDEEGTSVGEDNDGADDDGSSGDNDVNLDDDGNDTDDTTVDDDTSPPDDDDDATPMDDDTTPLDDDVTPDDDVTIDDDDLTSGDDDQTFADDDAQTEDDDCVGDCTGRECGDDGMGGSCGVCPEGEICIDGRCERYEPPFCSTDADCPYPDKPICDVFTSKQCVECAGDSDCQNGMCCNSAALTCTVKCLVYECDPPCAGYQYCDTTKDPPECVGDENNCGTAPCSTHVDCRDAGEGNYCDLIEGVCCWVGDLPMDCSQCVDDIDCPAPFRCAGAMLGLIPGNCTLPCDTDEDCFGSTASVCKHPGIPGLGESYCDCGDESPVP